MKAFIVGISAVALVAPANATSLPLSTQVTDTVCQAKTVPVYFEKGATQLSDTAKAVLAEIEQSFGACALTHIETSAISGDAATPQARADLAAARELAVLAELRAADQVETDQITHSQPVVALNDVELSLPSARRVEVTFHLLPPTLG